MTTIAYRDGIMAADSGSWLGSSAIPWARKVAKGQDGTLYGTSGNAAECGRFLDWVDGGSEGEMPKPRETKDEGSSFIVLMVPSSGQVQLLTAHGVEKYDAPYFAIGAGAPTAFGALFMGATPDDAIAAAIEHGEGAMGAVQSVRR